MARPTLLTGIKPTGQLHIGNYFGALRQMVDLQDGYQCYIFIPDLHALTTNHSQHNPEEVRDSIRHLALGYLAVGIDPQKVTIFQQSQVQEHTELTWLFNCITTMPYLMRAHAYKDAEAKNKEISVGVFDYPMLMAADILLYDSDVVPVGKDQQQHVEIARDTAEKFNHLYGETFKLPKALIREEVAVVPGTDGRKMSKSYGNTIPLFASRDEIVKAVMGIVTDSAGERPQHVFAIHKLIKPEGELIGLYEEHKGKYKALKEALIEDMDAYLAPMRARYEELAGDPQKITDILEDGARQARAVASAKMAKVRAAVGVV